ncbi:hypothetical protein B0H14DRAFT_1388678 [Mycena olivaceomarginata]|nr:hypothetical protein B0H14DRAFT_1388678 [Mycena olivaceomarginata]
MGHLLVLRAPTSCNMCSLRDTACTASNCRLSPGRRPKPAVVESRHIPRFHLAHSHDGHKKQTEQPCTDIETHPNSHSFGGFGFSGESSFKASRAYARVRISGRKGGTKTGLYLGQIHLASWQEDLPLLALEDASEVTFDLRHRPLKVGSSQIAENNLVFAQPTAANARDRSRFLPPPLCKAKRQRQARNSSPCPHKTAITCSSPRPFRRSTPRGTELAIKPSPRYAASSISWGLSSRFRPSP